MQISCAVTQPYPLTMTKVPHFYFLQNTIGYFKKQTFIKLFFFLTSLKWEELSGDASLRQSELSNLWI